MLRLEYSPTVVCTKTCTNVATTVPPTVDNKNTQTEGKREMPLQAEHKMIYTFIKYSVNKISHVLRSAWVIISLKLKVKMHNISYITFNKQFYKDNTWELKNSNMKMTMPTMNGFLPESKNLFYTVENSSNISINVLLCYLFFSTRFSVLLISVVQDFVWSKTQKLQSTISYCWKNVQLDTKIACSCLLLLL